ncbi:hypothetical protein SteCoe_31686 [Stentor coeruleus]|uniref:Uncharacterized protein n=1 Tax=Stentor coeruleus TaxID=5963 RepID=A0A1R2B0P7_9CILI|nr:hypothetical protein SteCoe_31686 [Stentor coeruleus]
MLQTSDTDFDLFSGTMDVLNDAYEVECDCTDEGMIEVEEIKCQPSKIKLSQDRDGIGSTYEEVTDKLESYENFTYAKVTHSSFRCLDGRIVEPLLGTPGGDAGEFVLGLLVYQDLIKTPLTEQQVLDYLQSYLKCMETTRFYMCTDQISIDHVMKELAIDNLDIFNPGESIQANLLEALLEPNNIGDTHLRMLVEYPELYSINNDVVKHLIKAFYTVLWDDENPLREILYLDILQGTHTETGFLEVKINQECLLEEVAPLIAPKDTEDSVMSLLVNHIDAVEIRRKQIAQFFAAVEIRRKQIAQFFAEKIDYDNGVTTDKLKNRLHHHGLLFLDVTGSYISKDLAFYTANFV